MNCVECISLHKPSKTRVQAYTIRGWPAPVPLCDEHALDATSELEVERTVDPASSKPTIRTEIEALVNDFGKRLIKAYQDNPNGFTIDRPVDAIMSKLIKELQQLSLDVIEHCEPECSEVRHALHQGSWNAHLKIEEHIERLRMGVE